MITTRVSRSFLGRDPMQLRSEGYGDLILIVIDAGEVRIEVTIGGNNAGSIEGRAHRAQMSTTAMPEPARRCCSSQAWASLPCTAGAAGPVVAVVKGRSRSWADDKSTSHGPMSAEMVVA